MLGLHAADITMRYPTPRGALEVLSGVSLELAPGDAAAIMGPSGSGKSTLLYILGALETPSSGRVTLDEEDPYALPESALALFRNRKIGFVFQDHLLLPHCSVLENVLAPTLVDSSRDGPADRERALTLLAQVGLTDRIDHRPAELSGGERQRAAVARALIRRPRLVLCDEPTGNLDRATAEAVVSLLIDLHTREQTILVVVTHSTLLAERLPVQFDLVDRRLVRRRVDERG
ncbi:MAG: ATP-binding cassette domain-containing protein [Luteitalea sp.]|nr:ATP-binding cassette domain-containing protein [Luteitalea sp.]